MAEWDNGEHDPWEVPAYLRNTYAVWTLIGQALEATSSAHHGAHMAEEGYVSEKDGLTHPPDSLMTALFATPIDPDELEKFDLGDEYISLHDALATAIASLQLSTLAVVAYVSALGALPPWWQDEFDALTNLPEMWEEDDGS